MASRPLSRHPVGAARLAAPRRRGPTVSVLAYDGMSVFETGIVTEVFGLPRPEFDMPWYELVVVHRDGRVRCISSVAPR